MPDSNRTGVFLLSTVLERSLDGYWENQRTDAQYAWWFGGQQTAAPTVSLSSIERLDYANDNLQNTIRGLLSDQRYAPRSVGNANYAWIGTGLNAVSAFTTSLDRHTYASDTVTAVVRGNLPTGRTAASTLSSTGFGYWVGGRNNPLSTRYSFIHRSDFSNDTATAPARAFMPDPSEAMGKADGDNYGYLLGGLFNAIPGLNKSHIYRIDYASDAIGPIIRSDTGGSEDSLSAANNSYAVWFWGGSFGTNVKKYDLTNDTTMTSFRVAAPSPTDRVSVGNSNSNYGWFNGGFARTFTDRITFANDTASMSSRALMANFRNNTTDRSGIAAYRIGVGFGNFGWWAGGLNSGFSRLSSVERYSFSNDVAALTVRANLALARNGAGSTSNGLYGWFAGGQISPTVPAGIVSSVDRLEYATDTAQGISVRGPLSAIRRRPFSLGTQSYAWFGTSDGSTRSDVERIDYTNDSPTIGSRRTLNPNALAAGTNNDIYGWIGGGQNFGARSDITRITFANDTAAVSTRAPLLFARYYLSAKASSLYGYWSGGSYLSNYSSVERLDFGADLVTTIPRGNLGSVKFLHAGAGTSYAAWFGGGYNPSVASNIDRVDFASDGFTTARTNLLTARTDLSAVNNFVFEPVKNIIAKYEIGTANTSKASGSFGYVIGGGPSGNSIIERIDFSNDTTTILNRGFFLVSRTYQGKFNNSQYGWSLGGLWPVPGRSEVYRLDFSNDTTTVIMGNLSRSSYLWSGATSPIFGYLHGGYDNNSSITRFDFANDNTVPGLVRANSPTGGRPANHCLYNRFYGWWGGGDTPGPGVQKTNVIRLDYGNDTVTPSVRSNAFNSGDSNSNGGATGNSLYGYFNAGARSSINRFDYNNDLLATVVRSNLTNTADAQAATSTQTYGYWTMGRNPSFFMIATVDRLDLSNDTATALFRNTLAAARYGGAAYSDYGID